MFKKRGLIVFSVVCLAPGVFAEDRPNGELELEQSARPTVASTIDGVLGAVESVDSTVAIQEERMDKAEEKADSTQKRVEDTVKRVEGFLDRF